MTRGGKRPGAGAPKGNLNALKTGSRSQQLTIVIEALLASPIIRRVLVKLVQQDIRRNRALQDTVTNIARRHRERSIKQNGP